MADIWEILWLCNDYSLATPPYNSATIQAFQQTIQHTIQRLIYEYYALCYVLLLSYFSVWFWISTPPSHVKLPPDPLQNPAYFLSYLHNIQVFIRTYSWKFTIVIPSTRYNLFHTYSGPFPTKKHKATTHPIPHLFQQREHKATINYSTPIPTKKHKATAPPILHLFQQRKHKATTWDRNWGWGCCHMLYMFPSLHLSFLPAFLVLKQLRCQHKSQFSLPHPLHCSTLSLSNSLTGPNTVHALQQSPAVSYAPSLLRKGNATTKGSSGVAFNLTTLFD